MKRVLEVGKAYCWNDWYFAVVADDGVFYTLVSLTDDKPHSMVPSPGGLIKVHVHSAVAQGAVLK